MLINILGGDGVGKTTQVARLIDWVPVQYGLPASSIAKRDIFNAQMYPECNFFGATYEHVAHVCLPKMEGTARAFWLYYMNSVLAKNIMQHCDCVIFHDGYWHKHFATEAAMGLDSEWLLAMGDILPEPDLTVMLDIDPREVVRRGHKHRPYESGCDFECSDAAFVAHQDKVRTNMLCLARNRNYCIIDANQDENAVFESLIDIIAPALEALMHEGKPTIIESLP